MFKYLYLGNFNEHWNCPDKNIKTCVICNYTYIKVQKVKVQIQVCDAWLIGSDYGVDNSLSEPDWYPLHPCDLTIDTEMFNSQPEAVFMRFID